MSLPVSQYEALLAEVRGLRRKAQHVQQLAIPLISKSSESSLLALPNQSNEMSAPSYPNTMESLLSKVDTSSLNYEVASGSSEGAPLYSDDECGVRGNAMSVSSEPISQKTKELSLMYNNGTWPVEKTLWSSEPPPSLMESKIPTVSPSNISRQETTSVMSFASCGGVPFDKILANPNLISQTSSQQLEAKVDMVYSLLAMLSGQEHADMGDTLLALSTNPESCYAMRESGCIPLLVQMIQMDKDADTRDKASQALHNLIQHLPDEKQRKRESRIFKLLEQIRVYFEALQLGNQSSLPTSEDGDSHPVQTVAHLMKLSFDESHRHAICLFGGINIIARLIETEHVHHSDKINETHCMLMRRYSCMALTNLTFGDSGNKSLLCSFKDFMKALIAQLRTSSDELRQVTASVLRNLSWRADPQSKEILREVGSVTGLMRAAMVDNKENTLKSILSALWNLSAHCTENKAEICVVDGALGFLVDMLTYKTPSKSLAIIENSGGILRNISSQVAVKDEYRKILRQHNCLQILLDQLKSPSLTIVSNACGTLWNLSAKCAIDQEILWQLGAPTMLRSLNHSKHKMIAMGSSAALRNLLSARPQQNMLGQMDSTALAMDLPILPTLGARKQKALMQDLDQNLSETCENIEKDSPIKTNRDKQDSNLNITRKSFDEANFKNMNIEPSTSFDKAKFSVSYSGIPKHVGSCSKSFIKSMPKKVAKTEELVTNKEYNNKYKNENCNNEGMDCSVNNEILEENSKEKLKEDSNQSDEKDSCSLEDVDNQDAVEVSKEPNQVEKEEAIVFTKEYDYDKKNVDEPVLNDAGMYDGQIDEIDLEDISVYFSTTENATRGTDNERRFVNQDQWVEKQDTEKEEYDLSAGDELDDIIDLDVSTFANHNVDQNSTGVPANAVLDAPTCNSKLNGETYQAQDRGDDAQTCVEPRCDELSQPEESKGTGEIQRSPSQLFANSEYPYLDTENFVVKSERDRLLERSCEETNRLVDNRMLDPDAMIESLERFTAELVSQASSNLQNKWDGKPNDNTWNDQTSSNDMTFPSISNSPPNVITFDSEQDKDLVDGGGNSKAKEYMSNDFSSVNTSTMTESTLIAMEATRMANVFKSEAEMSESQSLVAPSLDFDNSSGRSSSRSPSKVVHRKCPPNLMVKRALSNSLNNGSSQESLPSLSNLDQVNPPSILGDLDNLEGSMVSVASLPSENPTKADFVINGMVNRNNPMLRRPMNLGSDTACVSDLENINPPSIFNEITDLCNSLADVGTETICSEMDVFEDCRTHVGETTVGDDITEFSDANSVTPIQSDLEFSPEATPRKIRNLSKSLTMKQRRSSARDRYKTYTVAAEIIMQEETEKLRSSTSEDFKTADCFSTDNDDVTYVSPTYTKSSGRMTPKERRQNDRSRFETRVIDEATLLQSTSSSSPRDKPSIRNNYLHKRFKNKDRYKTQTLSDFSEALLNSHPLDEHSMVQKEANLVLKTLSDFKTNDELLDCETLSLVSNDDDSDHLNSASSINYRTYHKSWGVNKSNIPQIQPTDVPSPPNTDPRSEAIKPAPETTKSEISSDEEESEQKLAKPKISKPSPVLQTSENEKGIRGRRKPLYSKSNISNKIVPKTLKPIRTITSNVVKDVTSTLKTVTNASSKQKVIVKQQMKVAAKPPVSRASSGYGTRPNSSNTTSPSRKIPSTKSSPKKTPPLERQGTFTKDATKSKIPASKIPASRLAKPATTTTNSRIPSTPTRTGLVKSASSDRANRDVRTTYNRSASADSREAIQARKIESSKASCSSTTTKKSLIPQHSTPRSNSNSSLNSETSARKQVTSKIANLWKKIEESKNKQPVKKDTRVWIKAEGGGEPSC